MAPPAPFTSELYRELGAPPARIGARLVASGLDLLLLAVVEGLAYLAIGVLVLGAAGPAPVEESPAWERGGVGLGAAALMQAPVMAVWFWNRVVRVARGGSSTGMRWAGIRLVAIRSGTAPSVDAAVLRELLGLLLLLPLGLGFLPMLFDRQRRGLHDRAAGLAMIAPRL